MSETAGMIVGTLAVLVYVVVGGFLAVAWTDFIQMIVLVVGLAIIAVFAADLAGGADKVIAMATSARTCSTSCPSPASPTSPSSSPPALTMMLGSIPQQDVFQRVMSAKDADTARNGAVIGGVSYILFAFVPMFIVASAVVVMGDSAHGAGQERLPAPAADLRADQDAAGDADPVLRRAAVRHQEHVVGHACWRRRPASSRTS